MTTDALTWRELNTVIGEMTEETLRSYINYENSTTKRKTTLLRLHQRYEALRSLRERAAILNGELL
jgi:ubiquitin